MELATVSLSFNPAEAQMVRSRLEAAGFYAVVAQELSALSMGGYGLGAGGILVQVPEDQLEEAREFLSAPGDLSDTGLH